MQSKGLTSELIAEFIGTALLVLFGDLVVAMAVFNGAYAGQWQPSVLWGATVTLVVYATGAVSGAHINPAVTLGLAAFRGFPKAKVLPYMIAQVIGGAVGAAVLYIMTSPLFAAFETAKNIVRNTDAGVATAKIFATYPGANVDVAHGFLIEIVLTAMLFMVIIAIGDDRSPLKVGSNLGPLFVGLAVALLVGVGGPLTMASMNPARDFGPRLFMVLAGWGSTAIPGPNGYVLAGSIAPFVGALVGGLLYDFGIRAGVVPAASQKKAA